MVASVGREPIANDGPGLIVNQRRMLPLEELALVRNLPGVDRVWEQVADVPARDRFAAARGAIRRHAALCLQPEAVGLLPDPMHAAKLTIKGEDTANGLGLDKVDDQRALARIVA